MRAGREREGFNYGSLYKLFKQVELQTKQPGQQEGSVLEVIHFQTFSDPCSLAIGLVKLKGEIQSTYNIEKGERSGEQEMEREEHSFKTLSRDSWPPRGRWALPLSER